MGSSRRNCTGKRFSASFQRVMLVFISFCSKERFRLSSARLRCFQHYVSENRLFLVFLRKLCFWPFILSKTCFAVLAVKSDVSSILLQKNSDLFFLRNTLFWVSWWRKYVFCMLATKWRRFEVYITKKAFLLKTFFFSISLNLNFTRNKKKTYFVL